MVLLANAYDDSEDFLVLDLSLNPLPPFGGAPVTHIAAAEEHVLALTFGFTGDWGIMASGYDGSIHWGQTFKPPTAGSRMTQDDTTIYVVGSNSETGHGFIQRLSAETGATLDAPWEFISGDVSYLHDVAVADNNDVHVAGVSVEDSVQKLAIASFSPAGKIKSIELIDPAASGMQPVPTDIDLNTGTIIVSHTADGLVGFRASTAQGEFLWHLLLPGEGRPESSFGENGEVYIAWETTTESSRLCRVDIG